MLKHLLRCTHVHRCSRSTLNYLIINPVERTVNPFCNTRLSGGNFRRNDKTSSLFTALVHKRNAREPLHHTAVNVIGAMSAVKSHRWRIADVVGNTKDSNKLGGRWLRTKWWYSPRAPAAINSKNRYYLDSHNPASTPSLAVVNDKKQRKGRTTVSSFFNIHAIDEYLYFLSKRFSKTAYYVT